VLNHYDLSCKSCCRCRVVVEAGETSSYGLQPSGDAGSIGQVVFIKVILSLILNDMGGCAGWLSEFGRLMG
jgi:hypothetical protein